ncbi:hypothetical protein B0D71_03115 [Pseudomonas laurylsulfativorans]|uniref:Transposase n=1 Tax=Pseudomonas laurylsulfativorans TaxID=1943631 RepID=A0A2S3VV39_9PSED|nr:hypothetical protein B0D71_03115 [Pseudomonas laurylsulfativorans]
MGTWISAPWPNDQEVVEAILWKLRTGAPWHGVPVSFALGGLPVIATGTMADFFNRIGHLQSLTNVCNGLWIQPVDA